MKPDGDNIKIILKEISVKDAKSFYRLYLGDEPNIQAQTTDKEHMNPIQFTEHILSLCEERDDYITTKTFDRNFIFSNLNKLGNNWAIYSGKELNWTLPCTIGTSYY